MGLNLPNIAATSLTPGIFNSGSFTATAEINGTLPAAGTTTSLLTGVINITLEDPSVICELMFNLPDANQSLATAWIPLIGSGYANDESAPYSLILYDIGTPTGRQISYNFYNYTIPDGVGYTFTNYKINFYGHLYSYPW